MLQCLPVAEVKRGCSVPWPAVFVCQWGKREFATWAGMWGSCNPFRLSGDKAEPYMEQSISSS